MSEVRIGDIVCKAGRGIKCEYKRNATFVSGQVKGQSCALLNQQGLDKAANELSCSYAGTEVK